MCRLCRESTRNPLKSCFEFLTVKWKPVTKIRNCPCPALTWVLCHIRLKIHPSNFLCQIFVRTVQFKVLMWKEHFDINLIGNFLFTLCWNSQDFSWKWYEICFFVYVNTRGRIFQEPDFIFCWKTAYFTSLLRIRKLKRVWKERNRKKFFSNFPA